VSMVSTVLDTPLFLGPILSAFSYLGVQKSTHKNSEGQKLISAHKTSIHTKVSEICVTTVLLCHACVRVRNGKKDSNPLLSKLRDLPRRVVCSGVFVIRTQNSFAKVFVVRFVRSPDCSLTGHPLYMRLVG
jgi:hypothetical protein